MTTNLVLDARQRAILAEMGVRVWMPAEPNVAVPQAAQLSRPEPVSAQAEMAAPVAIPVRREPPLRLPVMDAPPVAALGATRYVIGNLASAPMDYDLIVLGETCQGAAEQLLINMLKVLAPFRIFIAYMVASHNDSVNLSEQLGTLPAKLVLALGPHAAKAVLGDAAEGIPFSKQRGSVHGLSGDTAAKHRVIVTYHPQQLLRQPLAKASNWQDIRLVLKALRQS